MKPAGQTTHPKRQHWAPECYLEAWWEPTGARNEKPGVWVIDRTARTGKQLSIDNVCVETHMYTMTLPNGERDFDLENTLAALEGLYKQVRDERIGPMKPLSDPDRLTLATFAAAMIGRTPRQREHIRGQWQQALTMMEDIEREMKISPAKQMPVSKVASGNGPSLTMDQVRNLVDQPLQHSLYTTMRAAGGALAQMSICVLVTDAKPGFITSDAPAVLYDPTAHTRPPMYRAVGFEHANAEFTLPLSPSQMLFCTWRKELEGAYLEVDDQLVDHVNRRTQFHADRWIICGQNATRDFWFEPTPLPADAWENSEQADELIRARSNASAAPRGRPRA